MFHKQMQRLLVTFLVLLLCVLPVMASAQEDLVAPDQQIQQEVTYQTDAVQTGTFTKETSFQAAEYYPCSWNISSPENGAFFVEYAVSQGAQVKAGDVLVRLSMGKDNITLARLERELARMQEEFATAVFLLQDKIAQIKAAADTAAHGYEKEQMEISVAIMQTQLDQFCYLQQRAIAEKQQEVDAFGNAQQIRELTAPADGTVTVLAGKNPEDPVAAGEVLVTLVRTDIRLLQVKDPAAELRCNMSVSIAVGRGNNQTVYTGRVVAAEDALAPEQRTGYAYVLPDPGCEGVALRDARITASTVYLENVMLVDRRAVVQENGKSYVMKLTNGVLQRRGILLGMSNLTDAWILAGVTEGDTLILY